MKKVLKCLLPLLLIVATAPQGLSQEEQPDMIWENVILVPDNTKLKLLEENMRAHNTKYHAMGTAHQAMVYNISTGPNVDKLVWSMGPTTYSNLDTRPAADGHDEDWRDNIMPYIKRIDRIEYWSNMAELSNTDMLQGDEVKFNHMIIRYHQVEPGHGYTINHLLKQMSEAIKAMDGENPFGYYANDFQQGNDIGRHFATIRFINNWADLDKPWGLRASFEKLHGENTWTQWQKGMDHTFHNSWDEIWSYNKDMSGH